MLIHKGKEINQVIFSGDRPVTKVYHLEKGQDIGPQYEVTFLEYIESHSSDCSYIDLNYTLNLDSEIEATIELNSNLSNSKAKVLFGGYSDKNGVCVARKFNSLISETGYDFGDRHTYAGFNYFDRAINNHFIFNKNGFTFDDETTWGTAVANRVDWPTPLRINADANPQLAETSYSKSTKYGEIIVKENGTVLHDYKPALVEGVVGFFDTKTKKFFSPTVGEFSAGPQL